MYNKEKSILHIDGKSYIPAILLEQMMEDRDKCIQRIELATETKRKLNEAKTIEEYEAIQIPDEFKHFGKFDKFIMDSYVSGFAMTNDASPRCYYGNMGSPASIIIPDLFR